MTDDILTAHPGKTVLLVEREVAADLLQSLGFVSGTMDMAALAPGALRGRRVVVLPTNSPKSRQHATVVVQRLKLSGAQTARTLNLPNLKVNEDVFVWLDQGHTLDELSDLVRRCIGITTASSIVRTQTEWMWAPRIPAKGLTLFFGEAGIGKTTMVIDMVSRWTTGRPMPESADRQFKPCTVAMYGFEDDTASVVVPRLIAAGADLDRVVFLELDPKKPVLPDQVDHIRQICTENDVKVLVMDNVENAMGLQTDTNNSKSLRAVLSPLSFIGIPVLAIHHPKKAAVFGSPLEAMGGSQAFTNVARSVLTVMQVDDVVALAAVKSNYAPVNKTRTLYFKVEGTFVEECGSQPKVSWVGGDNTTAEMLYAAKAAERLSKKSSSPQVNAPPPTAPTNVEEKNSDVNFYKLSKDLGGIIPEKSEKSRTILPFKSNSYEDNSVANENLSSVYVARPVDTWVEEQRQKAVENGVISTE